MKRLFGYMVAALAMVLAPACAGNNIETTNTFNPDVDATDWRSFAWIGDRPMIAFEGEVGRRNPVIEDRIESAIRQVLEEKGFTYVTDRARADFVVGYTVGVRDQIDIRTYPRFDPYYDPFYGGYYGYYGAGRYGRSGTDISVNQYQEGVLGIDIFDAGDNRPAWAGRSIGRITSAVEEDPLTAIDEAVRATLASVPQAGGALNAAADAS